eukprot:gene2022-3186_t
MSYILYCWHFPIAVLLKYTSANTYHELTAELKAGGIAASFAAGVAIVEPFCRKKDAVSDRKFMCGVFCVWLGFLLFATFGASRGGVRYSDFMPTDDGGAAGPGTALGSSCAFNSGGGGSTPGHVIFKLVNTSASQDPAYLARRLSVEATIPSIAAEPRWGGKVEFYELASYYEVADDGSSNSSSGGVVPLLQLVEPPQWEILGTRILAMLI